MNTIEAQANLDAARVATQDARFNRDQANDSRIRHASIAGYAGAFEAADLAVSAALEQERAAEAALAAATQETPA